MLKIVPLESSVFDAVGKFFAEQLNLADELAIEKWKQWLKWVCSKEMEDKEALPHGWVLLSKDKVAGVHMTTPFLIRHHERERVCYVSSNYYTSEEVRGLASFGLFKTYMKRGQSVVLWCSTANETSSALWEAVSAKKVESSCYEWIRLRRWNLSLWGQLYSRFSEKLVGKEAVRAARVVGKNGSLGPDLDRFLESSSLVTAATSAEVANLTFEESQDGIVRSPKLIEWLLGNPMRPTRCVRVGKWFVLLDIRIRGVGRGFPVVTIVNVWGGEQANELLPFLKALSQRFAMVRASCEDLLQDSEVRDWFTRRRLGNHRRWILAAESEKDFSKFRWNGVDEL